MMAANSNKQMPLASKSNPGGAVRHPGADHNAHGSHQGDNAVNMDCCGNTADQNGC